MSEEFEDLTLVPRPSKKWLNERQLVDYREHRRKLLEWLLRLGKDPTKAEGYAFQTVANRSYRMDVFYRWVWEQEGRYTTRVTHEHADNWVQELAYSDYSNAHKNNCLKALNMLFKWRHHEFGEDLWEPEMRFQAEKSSPRDYLTREERAQIREAALEYGSVPKPEGLSSKERSKWKAYLAQRFEKPKNQVTREDWDRANDWKIPSLVWVSLDTGLRPIEVERAVTGWVDTENGVLRIPKEDSSKNRDNWVVGLRDDTSDMLARWLEQREAYDKYQDTDRLWLTRQGNPYQSQSLRYVLERLCEIAGISTEHRRMSWYAIRHSVGTYMTHVEDLGAAGAQLRHKSVKTTLKYDQAPVEERKDALDKMG